MSIADKGLISMDEMSSRTLHGKDKTYMLFGSSVELRRLLQGVIDHISECIKRRARCRIGESWYGTPVGSNW
jgi:hypothetical protein